MRSALFTFAICLGRAAAHGPSQVPLNGMIEGDFRVSGMNLAAPSFAGISTYGLLPHQACLDDESIEYDIGIIGIPFDVGVSYRPGARFGPSAIRQASRTLTLAGGYNVPLAVNPFKFWGRALDCGDIPVIPYDKHEAMDQIERGYTSLLQRNTYTKEFSSTKTGSQSIPRLLTLGGDHTILLPILRSIKKVYGPMTVIHFDAHLDSWNPSASAPTKEAVLTHGSFFYLASKEGLLHNDTNIHAGLRTTLGSLDDYEDDDKCGFVRVEAHEIDRIGVDGIIEKIKKRVGLERPVYLSMDIDTLDPANAPATGTPETGGWTSREMRTIIRGLSDLNIIGADLVELAPAYDTNAEVTALAAAALIYEVMSIFVQRGPMRLE